MSGALGYKQLPSVLGISYIAFTTLILAYSSLFNIFPILVFLGLWFAHILYGGRFVLRPSRAMVLMLLVPVWALYSTLWSMNPGHTLYNASQFISLALCTVIMARIVRLEDFVKGLSLGLLVVLLIALLLDKNELSSLGGGLPLIGLFGSKNQLGLMAELCALASLFALFIQGGFLQKFIFGMVPLVLGLFCLYLSESITSIMTLLIALAMLSGFVVVGLLPRVFRLIAVFGFAVLGFAILGGLHALGIDIYGMVLDAVGKSATFTGRTYLWDLGLTVAQERPFLGHGYNAFWLPGNPIAEGVWQKFGITGKSGFHFHSMMIEWYVGMGLIGFVFAILLFLILIFGSVGLIVREGLSFVGLLVLSLTVMFLGRAFFELDLNGPYGLTSFVFYSLFQRLEQQRVSA